MHPSTEGDRRPCATPARAQQSLDEHSAINTKQHNDISMVEFPTVLF